MQDAHQLDALLYASDGSKVGVFARTLIAVQEIHSAMVDWLEDETETVRRLNGQHEISFPNGGRIRFLSFNQSARGLAFDRVYVPLQTPSDLLAELLPSIATSDDGTVTGYL
jgi:hypothetical protein